MHKINIWFIIKILLLPIIVFASENNINQSSRTYSNIDEQKVYNIVKKMYYNNSKDYIVDTSWDKLHISKRSTFGFFLDIEMSIDNLILTTTVNKDSNSTNFKLETYNQTGEIIKPIRTNNFLHTIFWNRIEYASKLTDNWIDCKSFYDILLLVHPLCTINKEQL